ncbi:ORF6N domain-containing protein [Candidatus Parcubacteria bacterium]|nr:ORF6N domain-containing protein [Candidatus Parcubacteria bacterium]
MTKKLSIIPQEIIEGKIFSIRGQKVMLDEDLAELYGVETRVLIQAVRRNKERFPEDFVFQLDKKEDRVLRSQFVISKKEGKGGRRYLPYVFTEHGVLMLSSVLKSKNAIQVNIQIMRIFVKIRKLIYSYKALADKMDEIDKKYGQKYKKHSKKIQEILAILNYLIKGKEEENKNKSEIGFKYKRQ